MDSSLLSTACHFLARASSAVSQKGNCNLNQRHHNDTVQSKTIAVMEADSYLLSFAGQLPSSPRNAWDGETVENKGLGKRLREWGHERWQREGRQHEENGEGGSGDRMSNTLWLCGVRDKGEQRKTGAPIHWSCVSHLRGNFNKACLEKRISKCKAVIDSFACRN